MSEVNFVRIFLPIPRGERREEVTIAMLVVFIVLAVLLSQLLAQYFSTATTGMTNALQQVYTVFNETQFSPNSTVLVDLTPVYQESVSIMDWIKNVLSNPTLVLLLMCISIVVYIILYTHTRGA